MTSFDTIRAALLEEAREEWEALGLVGSHGFADGVDFADLGPDDVEQIRDLIKRLSHALDADSGALRETRQALQETLELAAVSADGDPWYAERANLDADAILARARAVLAGVETTE